MSLLDKFKRKNVKYVIQKMGEKSWVDGEVIEEDVPYMNPHQLREWIIDNINPKWVDGVYRMAIDRDGRYYAAWTGGIKRITIGMPNRGGKGKINVHGMEFPVESLDDLGKLNEMGMLDDVKEQNSVEAKLLDFLMQSFMGNKGESMVGGNQGVENMISKVKTPGSEGSGDLEESDYGDLVPGSKKSSSSSSGDDGIGQKVASGVAELKKNNPDLFHQILNEMKKSDGGK